MADLIVPARHRNREATVPRPVGREDIAPASVGREDTTPARHFERSEAKSRNLFFGGRHG